LVDSVYMHVGKINKLVSLVNKGARYFPKRLLTTFQSTSFHQAVI
jgi:hypothetical protein